ncbi:MAG: methanethiol S-methyltransferase, partial [Planctomycetota bacterium]
MARAAALIYGLVCYVMFLGVFLYLIGFLGNFLVPTSVDSGPEGPLATALLVNVLLLAIFGVQHTVMARPTFKRSWTKIVPTPVERSTYVLITNLLLILLYWQWRPLWALFGAGWLLVLVATLQINHADIFGIRQVWLYFRSREYTPVAFATPILYRHVRHPLYAGWITAFWATPSMTAGHLVFAVGTTVYILIAIYFEERNLVQDLGEGYVEYRKRTPMLAPRPWRHSAAGP